MFSYVYFVLKLYQHNMRPSYTYLVEVEKGDEKTRFSANHIHMDSSSNYKEHFFVVNSSSNNFKTRITNLAIFIYINVRVRLSVCLI